ncbi:hypothetical protein RQY88_004220 [Vibrio vulnificus]|nr:hypothetical protein [Vibrio vulnificus]ELH9602904.1 hypothetical protein [Vibrio vulnificus]ELH9617243.1 hypothetical protein [Vibrio vulnificus]
METLEEKVTRYREHFMELISVAEQQQNLAHQKVHSKILCCSVFDAISKSIFPDIKSNGQRFVALVRLCNAWPESQHVSVLHLLRLFEVTNELPKEAKMLEDHVLKHFGSRFKSTNSIMSNNISISSDIHIDDLLALWPKDNQKPMKVGTVLPHQLKHEHLLWLYRNSVVHEYRNPGNGVELGSSVPDYAFYQEVATGSSFTESNMTFTSRWELVYPQKLFINLCKNAVEVASEHHLKKGSSPFTAYSDGTYWLPDFNE